MSEELKAILEGLELTDRAQLVGVGIAVVILLWTQRHSLRRLLFDRSRRRHRRNVSRSKKVLRSLRTQTRPWPRALAYLRKLDPYVFEELLLTAFEARGLRVARNARYSGDGGVDGRVYVEGHTYLVQAKRYAGTVSIEHIRAFLELVLETNASGGLFVHTGRTPVSARAIVDGSRVFIVSGRRLVDLLVGKPVPTLAPLQECA